MASITTLTGELFSQILFEPLPNDYPLPSHLDLSTIAQIQGPHPWFLRLSSARVSSPGKQCERVTKARYYRRSHTGARSSSHYIPKLYVGQVIMLKTPLVIVVAF
jgi:hypothetical protein